MIVDGEFRFPRPTIDLYATTARGFADDVDAARTQCSLTGLPRALPRNVPHHRPSAIRHPDRLHLAVRIILRTRRKTTQRESE